MSKAVKQAPNLGLYIHIPFCKSKCVYCDFYSLPKAEAEMDRYVAVLQKHLAEMAPRCADNTVDTVYFGGGTPSYLGVKRLKALLKTVFKHYRIAKDAEVTVEANPESLGDWRDVRALRRAGVNRISLGVQCADDALLKTIGRIHSWQQVVDAATAVRKGKIQNLSLDLIYGLPGQTLDAWQETVKKVLALAPEHLSCYGLKVEEGTPLWNMQEEGLSLPDDDAQADMYLWAVEYLAQQGYAQYEISNFARPGRHSRHNLRYWQLLPYAGFGPGAHSDFGDVRYAYVRNLDAYCKGVEEGGDILSESEYISARDRDVEYLMLGLRTADGIERREFENRFRLPFSPIHTVLERFEKTGHAAQQEGRWHLTPEGFLLSNAIILEVLEALGQEKIRRQEAISSGNFQILRQE